MSSRDTMVLLLKTCLDDQDRTLFKLIFNNTIHKTLVELQRRFPEPLSHFDSHDIN